MQQIADAHRITKQAVSLRLAAAGIKSRSRTRDIDKLTLERLYAIERLPIEQIAAHFKTGSEIIRKALARHKIPTRPRIKLGGTIVDQLRALETGASIEIAYQGPNPYTTLHGAAFRAGIKIRIRCREKNVFTVTGYN